MHKAMRVKEIDGHRFEVALLGGRSGFAVYLELLRILGPALGGAAGKVDLRSVAVAADAKQAIGALLEQDIGPILQAAVDALARSMDSATVLGIVDKLAEVSFVDGKQLSGCIDAVFAGEPWLMTKWLAFAVEANFGGFFGSLVSRVMQSAAGDAEAAKG